MREQHSRLLKPVRGKETGRESGMKEEDMNTAEEVDEEEGEKDEKGRERAKKKKMTDCRSAGFAENIKELGRWR